MKLPRITGGSITKIRGLTERPVFFLHLHGDPNPTIVVKAESSTSQDFQAALLWGSKVMRNVNDQYVKVQLLEPDEVRVFKAVGKTIFKDGTSPQANNLAQDGVTWCKLPFVHGLQDAETRETDEVQKILAVIGRFMYAKFWRQLGRIVAVDIFIGNNDRFNTKGEWVNQGNVMYAPGKMTPHGERLVGLDTFNTFGGQEKFVATTGGFPALKILTDGTKRLEYATKCCRSVGKELAISLRRVNGKGIVTVRLAEGSAESIDVDKLGTRFEAKAPKHFAKGIEEGANDIRKYLRAKGSKYQKGGGVKALPTGVADRMTYLGW